MLKTSDKTKPGQRIRDQVLSELGLRDGGLSADVIRKGWSILEEMGQFGITRPLLSLLVERNLIDRALETKLQRELSQIQIRCIQCRQSISLNALNSEAKLKCKKCESVMGVDLKRPEPGVPSIPEAPIEERLQVVPLGGGVARPGPSMDDVLGRWKSSTPSKAVKSSKSPPSGSREGSLESGFQQTAPSTDSGEVLKPVRTSLNVRGSIKNFEIGEVLTNGPHGRVYRTRSATKSDGPALALKVLDPECSSDRKTMVALQDGLKDWVRGERAAPWLVHYLKEEKGLFYVVRPFIGEGYSSLSDMNLEEIEDRPGLLRRLALALKSIHAAGSLHGNLKLSNVFIHKGGKIFLVDPLLHILVAHAEGVARWKLLSRFPHNRSPEEIEGQQVDQAADVYALGWIFYAVLAGARPFSGLSSPEILRRHREGPCPELPAEWAQWRKLHAAMTALNPQDRPQDASAVVEAVEKILVGEKPDLKSVAQRETPSRVEDRRPLGATRFSVGYLLGPALLLGTILWLGWCFTVWSGVSTAFGDEDRLSKLYYQLAEEALGKARVEVESGPRRAREIWKKYLETFSLTPSAVAAEEELLNSPAPAVPGH